MALRLSGVRTAVIVIDSVLAAALLVIAVSEILFAALERRGRR